MKKILLCTLSFVALSLLSVVPVMADEYPIYVDSDYGYNIAGEYRSTVTTGMLRQIVAKEAAESANRLHVVARRWYSSGWEGSTSGYGYDTIARYEYLNHAPILADDSRLSSDDYKSVLWSVRWERNVIAANDTLKTIIFDYSGSQFLTFYTKVDTAYTSYAGRPYMLNQVSNPLMLPLNFTSENPTIATVNPKNGQITVVSAGETTITASYPGDDDIPAVSASWKLVVKNGDHYVLEILSKERSEHSWGSGGTYLAFDMIPVTEANCGDIYGDGTLSFNIETRTLTMRNFQRTFTQEEDDSMGWTDWLDYESGPLPLTIHIVGNCGIINNSAGFFTNHDLIITGDGERNSRLTMKGRFPQFSAGNNLTINGAQVHARANTPHPLMICNTLRVEDDSYYEAYMDIEVEPGEDPREWGAMVGQVNDVELGKNTIMLSRDVHVENGTFVDGQGLTALRVEIGPKIEEVISGDVNFSGVELTDDPTGDQINGILYTLGEGDGIDQTEGCLVLNSTMTADDVSEIIRDLTPGSAAFAEKFSGLSVLLPVGKGTIHINMQTAGNYSLAVQIGNGTPVLLTRDTRGEVTIPFDVNIATFAFIYAVQNNPDGTPEIRHLNTDAPQGSVKLYSLSLTDGEQGVEQTMFESSNSQIFKSIKNGTLLIERNGRTYTATGAEIK